MLIACPNCATSYQVEPSSVGLAGRSVRCARCRHQWFVGNPAALFEVARAHRADLAAIGVEITVPDIVPLAPAQLADEPLTVMADVAAEARADPPLGPAIAAPPPPESIIPPLPAEPTEGGVFPEELPPLAPADAVALAQGLAPLPAEHGGAGEDIETVAARRARRQADRRSRRWRTAGWPIALVALVAVNAGLVGWRSDVARRLPQTASLYAALGMPVNLRALVFAKITTQTESQDGVQVLVVEGTIVSTGVRPTEVPRLRFAVRNERGQEIYSWTALPSRPALAPGETLAFRARLASPPREGRDVLVRFFNRRDLVAGVN